MIFITIIDVKSGYDEIAYTEIGSLVPENKVTPILIGRIFEESDILLLLHSENLTEVDDYLIEHVRKSEAAQEITLIPIYEFSLLPSFDSVSELDQEFDVEEGYLKEDDIDEEYLMIMINIDIAPTMDKHVEKSIIELSGKENIIPLMAGRTFHSKEFDMVQFFLADNLEAAWSYVKKIRSIEGVWDTKLSIIAHFESMVSLEEFRNFAEQAGGEDN